MRNPHPLPQTVLSISTHKYIPRAPYNRVCRTSATAFMRVFLPVKVFISTSSPARCISEIISEQSLNAKTAWSRVFGFFGFFSFYYRFYYWY